MSEGNIYLVTNPWVSAPHKELKYTYEEACKESAYSTANRELPAGKAPAKMIEAF